MKKRIILFLLLPLLGLTQSFYYDCIHYKAQCERERTWSLYRLVSQSDMIVIASVGNPSYHPQDGDDTLEIDLLTVKEHLKKSADLNPIYIYTPHVRDIRMSAVLSPCDYLLFLTPTNHPPLLACAQRHGSPQKTGWMVTRGCEGAFSLETGWSETWLNIIKRKEELAGKPYKSPRDMLNLALEEHYGTNICHEIIPAVKAAVAYLEAPESVKKTMAESFRLKGGIYKDFIRDALYVQPTDEELWLEDFAHYKTISSNLLATVCETNTYAVISTISSLEYSLPGHHQERPPYIFAQKYATEMEEAWLRFGMRSVEAIYRYNNKSTLLTTNTCDHLRSKPKETWTPEEHAENQAYYLHCIYHDLVRKIQQRIRTTSPVRELTVQWINEEVKDPVFKEVLLSRKYLEDYEAAERARISKHLDEQDAKLKTYADRYAKKREESLLSCKGVIPDVRPGDPGRGFPGRIEPYTADAKLQVSLDKFGGSAYWFIRNAIPTNSLEGRLIAATGNKPPDRLPFLLFKPKTTGKTLRPKPVPMVVFFPGLGEIGEDLTKQFRQKMIFSVVTSEAFQAKHPCYLMAVTFPKEVDDVSPYGFFRPTEVMNFVGDIIWNAAAMQSSPPVDTNRVYLTGLSFGGQSVSSFAAAYPGVYAAFLPVATFPPQAEVIHPVYPGNWWLFYNEGDFNRIAAIGKATKAFQDRVTAQGGDCRIGTFPDTGHNAWDKAWQEEAVWEWMFSKSADGHAIKKDVAFGPQPVSSKQPGRLSQGARPLCTASAPGRDSKSDPARGADGLMATAYLSTNALPKGAWWMAEYPEPVSGDITLHLGDTKGKYILSRGRIETSKDGRTWIPATTFSSKNIISVKLRDKVRFIRVISSATDAESMAIRELVIE
jgi:hypothetical protein